MYEIYIHLHRFTRLLSKKCQLLNTTQLINRTFAANIKINIYSTVRDALFVCKKIINWRFTRGPYRDESIEQHIILQSVANIPCCDIRFFT